MTDLVEWVKRDITYTGIPCSVQTLSEIALWIRSVKQTTVPSFSLQDSVYVSNLQTPLIKLSYVQKIFSGSFGTLYSCHRTKTEQEQGQEQGQQTTHEESALIKSGNETQSLHVEALLQCISYSVLSFYGFSHAVPRVLDIFSTSRQGIVFTMTRCPEAQPFSDYLASHLNWNHASEKNDRILLSILAQIATYLAILEHELLLNHRDLTGSNVLLIAPCEPTKKTVCLYDYSWNLSYQHKTMMIDFGFAALGSLPSRKTLVQASKLDNDRCPKEGRDLFLFLASLWRKKEIRSIVTHTTYTLVHRWLTQNKTMKDWAQWLESADTDIRGMYLLTMSDSFENTHTRPLQILLDITHEFPDIVSFETYPRPRTPIPTY